MEFIKISPNHLINAAQIVEMLYTPGGTKFVKFTDTPGQPSGKNYPVESSMILTLVSGNNVTLVGSDADKLYAKVIGGQ